MYTTATTYGPTFTTSTLQYPPFIEPNNRPSNQVEVLQYKTPDDDYLPALLAAL